MSENIFLAIIGVIVIFMQGWKLIKNKSDIIYNACLFLLGVAIIIASIHKEGKDIDRETKYQSSDSLKNKKISDLDSNVKLVLHTLDSLGYRFDKNGNVYNYNTTIGSARDVYFDQR